MRRVTRIAPLLHLPYGYARHRVDEDDYAATPIQHAPPGRVTIEFHRRFDFRGIEMIRRRQLKMPIANFKITPKRLLLKWPMGHTNAVNVITLSHMMILHEEADDFRYFILFIDRLY